MTAASTRIAALLGDPGPFYRSVSIARDLHDHAATRRYVLTPWLERVASEILDGLLPGSRRRAWRVTGDFGVGKSALALALIRALDPSGPAGDGPVDRLARSAGPALPRMFPLVVSGTREGMQAALSRAIAAAAADHPDLIDAATAAMLGGIDPFDALYALRDLVAVSGRYNGLMLVADEMGKFLEASAADPGGGDVFRLQDLAEAAARSGDRPLAVVLILHQGLQSYQEDAAGPWRTEWAKVAERFDELVFDHPLTHTAALLSAALSPAMADLPVTIAREYTALQDRVAELGWLGPRSVRGLEPCYPLHPACVPVLSRFFANYGQNERSLFGFVASEEPNGLRAFAAASTVGDGFYGIDRFFDYVSTSFGHRLISRGSAGDWERIRAVLDGASGASAAETAVLKSVGLLNLVDAPDLIATEETLATCLAPALDGAAVASAVASLRTGGILFERVARAGLRLWTSRRVDISALWAEAERTVGTEARGGSLAATLAKLPVRPFLLARRHSIETGTTRRFPVRLVPASALAVTSLDADADGAIVAVLPNDRTEARHAAAWAEEATRGDPTLVVLIAPPLPELKSMVADLLRHHWIEANAPALREDAYAAAEVERRIADLQGALVDALEATLGLAGEPGAAGSRMFRSGSALPLAKAAHLIVSDLCDELYHSSPLVQNELINRHALTSAAAAARQRLAEAMFGAAHEPAMGLGGPKNPPERALYLSVLLRGNVHRRRTGGWSVDVPEEGEDPLRLRPALIEAIDAIRGDGGRIGVTQVYARLAAPPYGVRAGLAPLLLAIILAANRHRVALFERGTYCPKVDGQAFMRILKAPEHFQLQWIALEGVRDDVYRRLAGVLGDGDGGTEGLLSVVSPIVRFAAGLNHYVQRSSHPRPTARAVRDALRRARSPVDLVFRELPAACGVAPFEPGDPRDAGAADAFAECLQDAVSELQGCYPALLDQMRTELAGALEAPGAPRENLAERAEPLLFGVREQSMRTFAQRLADRVLADDQWIEAIGGALVGKPPSRWTDDDVAAWRARLDDTCQAFLRLEATTFGDQGRKGAVVRLALTHADGRDRVSVISLEGRTPEQELFTRSLVQLIQQNDISPAIVLAGLAEAFISRADKEEEVAPADADPESATGTAGNRRMGP
jgi:hypothetical protein